MAATREAMDMVGNRLLRDSGVSVLAPAVWGSTYLVTTEFLPPDRPLLAALVRALPAGLLLVAIGRTLPVGDWWWRAAVLGTLNIGIFMYLLFVAAYRLPGGIAAFVTAIQPVIVIILAALLLGDRIRALHVLSVVAGAGGLALLVLQPGAGLDAWGVVAALTAALSMASGIVLTKRWGRPPGVGVLQFTGWQLTAGGLVLLPFTLLLEGLPQRIDAVNVAGFAYLAIIGALLAYLVWFRGIERLPAVAVSFLAFASPLVASLLGWVFLGQALSLTQLAGAAVIVAAVVLVQPRDSSRPETGGPTGESRRTERVGT